MPRNLHAHWGVSIPARVTNRSIMAMVILRRKIQRHCRPVIFSQVLKKQGIPYVRDVCNKTWSNVQRLGFAISHVAGPLTPHTVVRFCMSPLVSRCQVIVRTARALWLTLIGILYVALPQIATGGTANPNISPDCIAPCCGMFIDPIMPARRLVLYFCVDENWDCNRQCQVELVCQAESGNPLVTVATCGSTQCHFNACVYDPVPMRNRDNGNCGGATNGLVLNGNEELCTISVWNQFCSGTDCESLCMMQYNNGLQGIDNCQIRFVSKITGRIRRLRSNS
jgi:hypothetical protein